MSKKVKLGKGYYQEALHVSWMMLDMLEDYLINHPVVYQDKKLKKESRKSTIKN